MAGDGFDGEVQARRVMAQGTESDLGTARGSFLPWSRLGLRGIPQAIACHRPWELLAALTCKVPLF